MVVSLYQIYYTKTYNKATISTYELILTLFSPFDIKCKKLNLMRKTYGNAFLGHLEFFIFSQICTRLWEVPLILFGIFVGHLTILSTSPRKYLKMELLKLGNSWKLLLTVVKFGLRQ